MTYKEKCPICGKLVDYEEIDALDGVEGPYGCNDCKKAFEEWLEERGKLNP
jgi:endogenous inhibitor of DNA gyrase (YacG/DUF329 family)